MKGKLRGEPSGEKEGTARGSVMEKGKPKFKSSEERFGGGNGARLDHRKKKKKR